MRILDWIKKKINGGSSSSTSQKIREANRTSYYGGGVSTKSTRSQVHSSASAARQNKKDEQEKKREQVSSAFKSSAFKASTAKVKSVAETRDSGTGKTVEKYDPYNRKNAYKATGLPQTTQQKLQARMQADIDKKLNAPQSTSETKATPPTIKHRSTAMGTLGIEDTKKRLAKMNVEKLQQRERSRAADKLKPIIDAKYGGNTKEVKRRIKSGDYAADPDVAKYETLKHPNMESFGRGALSGTTFGLSDLAMAKLPMSEERREAERLYQANKNKGLETLGELTGSLASFGATSSATEKLAAKLAPNAAERLAEKQFIKNSAKRYVDRAVEKGLIGNASEELIRQVGRDKAAKIATAVGGDIVQNATTGLIYDFNKASAEYKVGSKDWWKEMGKSAAFNAVVTGGIAGNSMYRGGRNLVEDAAETIAKRADIRSALRPAGNVEPQRLAPRIGESIEDRIARLDAERLGAKAGVEPPIPRTEAKAEVPQAKTAIDPKAQKNLDDEVNAYSNTQKTLDDEVRKYDERKAAQIKEEANTTKASENISENVSENSGKKATSKEPRVINRPEDTVNVKREKPSRREKIREFTASVKTKVSDSLNAFEEANKQYIKTDHQKWLENVGAIDKTRRYNAIASRSIGESQVKWNGDVFEDGNSIKAIYDGMDDKTERAFDTYLLLKHAPARMREGKPIWESATLSDGRALGDPEFVKRLKANQETMDGLEKQLQLAKTDKAKKSVQKQIDTLAKKMEKDADETIARLSKTWDAEAERILKDNPEFVDKADDIYRYTRNELQNRVDAGLLPQKVADDWIERHPYYVPTGRDGYFNGVHGARGGVVGAEDLKAAEGSDRDIRSIKEQLAEATTRNWRDMSLNNLFRKMFSDDVADELSVYADGGLEKVLDNTINLSKTNDGGKYFAHIFEDGEMKRVEIDKRFYDAIEDLYKNGRLGNGIDVLADAATVPGGVFKNLITSWNPIFMVKNGFRDFPEAIINSRQTKEFLECMRPARKELTSGGEFYEAFRNSGVSQANFVNLEEALTKGDNWLKRRADKFATLQEMVETYPRLIEYMATIKKAGYDLKNGIKDVPMEIRDIAAANAADVTVNFGRSGSVGKMLNKGLVPFFNPSVQGWSKFLRNFSEQGSVKATLSFGLKALALGAGWQAINNAWLGDNPNYQQISARDKATNIIIPLAFGKDITIDNTNLFVKIPKSRFAATFSLPMVNAGNENKMGWAEMIRVAGDQVAPVDPVESNLLSPLLLAKANTTWYGTPIVSDGIKNEDNPSQEYDANTSWFGRQLGKATENLPTELQISPKKADYIIDAEAGVFGDFLLPMTTPSRQSGDKNAVVRGLKAGGNVLKRQFTIDSVTQNDLSTRFYKEVRKATNNSKVAKGTKEDKKNKEESKRLNGYSKEIGKINTAIRTLQNGNRKTKQEDIYGLQKVRNQMMQDAIDGKDVPSEYKAMDAVQKYVGTSYAVNHFGTSADKRAMKLYGEKKYGTLSAAERRKAINEDKDFYKGVQSIGKLQGKMKKAGIDSNTTLSRAIALASIDASDDLFGAYKAQDQSRTETAHEMNRARTYFNDGGSADEFVKLEKARKTLGKLPEEQRKDDLAKLDAEFSKGNMSYEEYDKREKDINYNADTSYLGLATSFALANSPERGYRVYDIKDANIRKGINIAAMGFTARDVHKMKNDLDTDGNGYPKKQEIIDYINKGNFNDKATLFDALYSYKGKYNPFGAVTNYTRAQAAAEGKAKNIEWITDETDEVNTKEEATSGGGGYYRRWGRWHRWGHSGGSSGKSHAKISPFKPQSVHPSEGGFSGTTAPKTSVNVKSTANAGSSLKRASTKATLPKASASSTSPRTRGASSNGYGGGSGSGRATTARVSTNVRGSQSRLNSTPKLDVTPLNIKPVKASKTTKGYNSNLSAALKDIENTQKKVAPPKARRK